MNITEKEVRYIAELANLRLSDEEVDRYRGDLDEILTYVDKLKEIDTSEVEPMAQVLYAGSETSTLRDDVNRPSFDPEVALRSAPKSGAGQFKVPRVIPRVNER